MVWCRIFISCARRYCLSCNLLQSLMALLTLHNGYSDSGCNEKSFQQVQHLKVPFVLKPVMIEKIGNTVSKHSSGIN